MDGQDASHRICAVVYKGVVFIGSDDGHLYAFKAKGCGKASNSGGVSALAGTAENIRLGHGPLGRGLFVIDPERPFLIRIPESLLANVTDIIFQDGILKVAPGANVGASLRTFYENYYANISWGGGGCEEIERIFEQAAELPPELRHKLFTKYVCGEWFYELSPELIQKGVIDSREISFQGAGGPFL